MNKITDTFPVVGGASGGVLSQNTLAQINNMWPPFSHIVYTVILAAIGALVGYLVKLLLDEMFSKYKKAAK